MFLSNMVCMSMSEVCSHFSRIVLERGVCYGIANIKTSRPEYKHLATAGNTWLFNK